MSDKRAEAQLQDVLLGTGCWLTYILQSWEGLR